MSSMVSSKVPSEVALRLPPKAKKDLSPTKSMGIAALIFMIGCALKIGRKSFQTPAN